MLLLGPEKFGATRRGRRPALNKTRKKRHSNVYSFCMCVYIYIYLLKDTQCDTHIQVCTQVSVYEKISMHIPLHECMRKCTGNCRVGEPLDTQPDACGLREQCVNDLVAQIVASVSLAASMST